MYVHNKDGKGNPYRDEKGRFSESSSDGFKKLKEEYISNTVASSLDDVSFDDLLREEPINFYDFDFERFVREPNEDEEDGSTSLKSTTENLANNPKCNSLYYFKKNRERLIDFDKHKTFSDKGFMSREKELELCQDVTKIIANAQVCCAIPSDYLEIVLESGKIYNQIELERVHGRSREGHGAIAPGRRSDFSNLTFGSKRDDTGVSYEKYGFLANKKLSELPTSFALDHYGSFKKSPPKGTTEDTCTCFVFDKSKMKEYNIGLTYTIGDSLFTQRIPALYGEEFSSKFLRPTELRDYAMNWYKLERVSDLPVYSGYVEAQFHGENGNVDVHAASYLFSTNPEYFEGEEGIKRLKLLKQHGIEAICSIDNGETTYGYDRYADLTEYKKRDLVKFSYDEESNKVIRTIIEEEE